MIGREKLFEILHEWNIWDGKQLAAGFERELTKKVVTFFDVPEVVVLKGVRRSGKSTLMFQLINELLKQGRKPTEILYVNFEEPIFAGETDLSLLNEIYTTYREYLNPKGPAWLFLDEIQRIHGWERWVRGVKEKERIKIFVTGSSSALLSKEFSSLLTGRHISFDVFPLSYREFLKFKGVEGEVGKNVFGKKRELKFHLEEYIKWGGFPEVVLNKNALVKRTLLKQYFEDIVYRDIVSRFNIRDIISLKRLAVYYTTNIGNKISFRKLGRDLDVPADVIRKYSSFLAESYLVNFVPIFSYSLRKQMRNEKKVYTVDSGIRNAVGFIFSKDRGRNIENIVYLELLRRGYDIFYWEDTHEVDFLCEMDRKKGLINVFSDGYDLKARERKGVVDAANSLGIKSVTIITEDIAEKIREKAVQIEILPLYRWLLSD